MYKILICMIFIHATIATSDILNLYERRTGRLIKPLVVVNYVPLLFINQPNNYADRSYDDYQRKSRIFFTQAETIAQRILFDELDSLGAQQAFENIQHLKNDLNNYSFSPIIHNKPVKYYEKKSIQSIEKLIKQYFCSKK